MKNNDILRKIRYAFDFSDDQMIKIFALAEKNVERYLLSNWLKKDEDPEFEAIYDVDLASFLNGFINLKRGKKEGEQPQPEKRLNNNLIFRKLKIALSFKDEDILDTLKAVDFNMSRHEISAFFRNPNQAKYRVCKDQVLRNFLHGLQLKYRNEV